MRRCPKLALIFFGTSCVDKSTPIGIFDGFCQIRPDFNKYVSTL